MPHEHIIKFYTCEPQSVIEVKRDGNWVKKREVFCTVVLELASGSDLQEHITIDGPFSEGIAKQLFSQLMKGIDYIHDAGVCHRDLKPANLLFDASSKLRIADFGFVGAEGNSKDGLFATYCGTPQYMAPEIHLIMDLQGQEDVTDDELRYEGAASDIFSAGVILFVMHVGMYPFLTAQLKDPLFAMIVNDEWDNFWMYF